MHIAGQVAPGYEPVKQLFEHNMRTLTERNTQLCVYVEQECVVDLWASAIDDESFNADSLVNVFSSGKTLEAITLAMLVDRGLLEYNAPISDYWPEYAVNGKSATTVADLMRHEAGLAAFDTTIDPIDLHPDRLRDNHVGRIIAGQAAKFRPGAEEQREYHAITRGWIANELFRRVDPAGRTMGEFLREEISHPLGIDVFIGVPDEELPRISPVALLGFGHQFVQGLIPGSLGRKVELSLWQTIAKLWRLRGVVKSRTRPGAPAPIAGMRKLSVFNSSVIAKAEIPSAGAKCSARGLAKLASVMADGARFGEQRLMGEGAYAALHDIPIERNMMALTTNFTQGGLALFGRGHGDVTPLDVGLNRGREDFYGWMGLGGSIFQWHPELKVGFAYAPTSLNALDIVNERGKAYQSAVVQCVKQQHSRS